MSEVSRLDELLEQKETARKLIDAANAVRRLRDNPDFKKIIVEGYLRDEAARYVQNSTDPNIGADERADSLAIAQATGYLKRYLVVIETMAAYSERTEVELAEAIDEARREELAS